MQQNKLDLYGICNPQFLRQSRKLNAYRKSSSLQQPLTKENILSEFNVDKIRNSYRKKDKNKLLKNFISNYNGPEFGDTKYKSFFVRRVIAALLYVGADPNVITYPAPLQYLTTILNDLELTNLLYEHGAEMVDQKKLKNMQK